MGDAKALEFIEEITKNADAVQKDVLTEILTQNAETEYLKSFNLDGATDRRSFKLKIPMVTYEDIHPLIQRIANGDQSPILCAQPITEFFTSSGTSAGEPKFIPIVEGEWDHRDICFSLTRPIINQYVKGLDKGTALYFKFTKSERKTPSGLIAHPASTSFYKNLCYKARARDMDEPYTSPYEAILCSDLFQSIYAQMLCGLYARQKVLRVGAFFASTLVRTISFLQLNWQQLAHDIRTGSLNPEVSDTSIREYMTRVMSADLDLANFISQECAGDNWEGIITRIWPNTKYLDTIVTGVMAQYILTLDYYSGGLSIVCTMYASSECTVGINLNPLCNPTQVSYTVMPNMAYFEFLPNESNSSGPVRPELIDLVDVEIGKEYELIVTTKTGLYRYQLGDILHVTGFHNSAPQFQFVRRKNVLLSIDMDKTNEVELQVAVEKASQLLVGFNTSVREYTSYADISTTPGHYVIYWELQTNDSTNSAKNKVLGLEQCCIAMEESLNRVYRVCRVKNKSVGPLEIRVVKNGTFEKLIDCAVSKGASIGQYKVPRCVGSKPILDLLDSQVISSHFSPSSPHWAVDT